eukprot:jgi/Botrbrau1/1155/Bobra.0162s0044.1
MCLLLLLLDWDKNDQPNFQGPKGFKLASWLPTAAGTWSFETDPAHDKISLHIFLSNDGLVQKPLERSATRPAHQQHSKGFNKVGLEGHSLQAVVDATARWHSGSACLGHTARRPHPAGSGANWRG